MIPYVVVPAQRGIRARGLTPSAVNRFSLHIDFLFILNELDDFSRRDLTVG